MGDLRVALAANAGDAHGDAIARRLNNVGIPWLRITPGTLPSQRMAWSPGHSARLLCDDGTVATIGPGTCVWWRNPSTIQTTHPDRMEYLLVRDELDALLPGVLEAAGVRWVDEPWTLDRCRLKEVQLCAARSAGVGIPETLVTGDPDAAKAFVAEGPVVAKAVSSGVGIAPYVDVAPASELWRLASCPTLLQRRVEAEADLRIVTVGDRCFSWLRKRASGEPLDWRAADPSGKGFRRTDDVTHGGATTVARVLDLTFSVQDWLLTPEMPLFLEVNTQGGWLFLAGADGTVSPALVDLLIGATK